MTNKRSSRFSFHKIITIFAVVIMVGGIGLTVFASQQTTQTESDAAGCRMKPYFDYKGVHRENDDSIVYKFNVYRKSNNCRNLKYAIELKPPGKKWTVEYRRKIYNWKNFKKYERNIFVGNIKKGDSKKNHQIRIRVTPPNTARSKTHTLTTYACDRFFVDGDYYRGDDCIRRLPQYTVN